VRRLFRRAGQAVVLVLLSLGMVAFLVLGALPSLTGLESRAILTGSMHPAIPAGSLVLVDTAGPAEPQVGDIVLFQTPRVSADVVHRIVAVDGDGAEQVFTTQGDANADVDRDPLVTSDILGEVRWSIPWLGHVMGAVQGNRAAALLLAVPAVIIVLMELPVWYRFVRHGRAAFEPSSVDAASPSRDEATPWAAKLERGDDLSEREKVPG